MEEEKKLAEIIFGKDPVGELQGRTDDCFLLTDQKQFSLFVSRLYKRVEERLCDQFGACLALLEEETGLEPKKVAVDFVRSQEYRQVREDLTDLIQASPARFEIAFLNFILRTQEEKSELIENFSNIFLHELAMIA